MVDEFPAARKQCDEIGAHYDYLIPSMLPRILFVISLLAGFVLYSGADRISFRYALDQWVSLVTPREYFIAAVFFHAAMSAASIICLGAYGGRIPAIFLCSAVFFILAEAIS